MGIHVAIAVVVWCAGAIAIGGSGMLKVDPGQPPILMLIAIASPIGIFLVLYKIWGRFRSYIDTRDIRIITLIQSWRIIGGVFIVLYFYDVLPGFFAWPAGLGDIAIGVSAPFVGLAVAQGSDFVKSRVFLAFHVLGIIDFVGALGTGFLASGWIPDFVMGTSPTSETTVLPLSIIPTFGLGCLYGSFYI